MASSPLDFAVLARLPRRRRRFRPVDRPRPEGRRRLHARRPQHRLVGPAVLDRRHRDQHRHLPEHPGLRLEPRLHLHPAAPRLPDREIPRGGGAAAPLLLRRVLHRLRGPAQALRGRGGPGGVPALHADPEPRRRAAPLPDRDRGAGDVGPVPAPLHRPRGRDHDRLHLRGRHEGGGLDGRRPVRHLQRRRRGGASSSCWASCPGAGASSSPPGAREGSSAGSTSRPPSTTPTPCGRASSAGCS